MDETPAHPRTTPEEFLTERKRIHDAATEGPWEAEFKEGNIISPTQGNVVEVFSWTDADAAAIVDAHNTQPAMVSALEKVLELHRKGSGYWFRSSGICDHCSRGEDETPWPCLTVRAITAALGCGEE